MFFIKVPYGVFEVKVSTGEHPLLVEELKKNDDIVEAPKFSKFFTGASLHNANKVVSSENEKLVRLQHAMQQGCLGSLWHSHSYRLCVEFLE
jgi:SPX domain protein involved in polyphosphate accumulation